MKVCVIIPAMNEERVLGATLQSILNTGFPKEHIYVINDGSKDATPVIAESAGVNVFTNPKNIGKAHSVGRITRELQLCKRYDVICMMDADTLVDPLYFRHVEYAFQKNPKAAAIAGTAQSRKHNWITSYRFLMYNISHVVYKEGQSRMGTITVIPGCAASYRSSAFEQLDWSSDTIVEDMDVTIQVHRKELGRIDYASKAIVHTQDPSNLRDYVKQAYRWQCGAWQIGKKYRMWEGLQFKNFKPQFSRVNLEWLLLMGEGMIFAALLFISPIWMLFHVSPPIVGYAFLGDAVFLMGLALISAMYHKRGDVFWYSPMYQILRFVDCGVFLYSFWVTVIQGRNVRGWNKVARYAGKEG